ncbi:MAG: Ig-like domain-containing protein [bacterium]
MSKSNLLQAMTVAVALSGLSLAVCTAAQAEVIKPVGATGNNAAYGGRYDVNTINGSGLSSTDMPADPVAGPWPSHNTDVDSMWLAYPKESTPNLTIIFDLGDVYALTGAHVWNYNEGGGLSNRGIKDVDVYVSNDTNTWGSSVDTWLFSQATGSDDDTGTNQNFSSATAFVRYVKFVPTSDWGGDSRGLSEVRFIGTVKLSVAVSPANGQAVSSATAVTATATVVGDTPPVSVTYYWKAQGESAFTTLGPRTEAPYGVSLGTLAAGTYQLYATVADSADPQGSATSATNTFTVGDLPPEVAITSPTSGTRFLPGVPITIDATATDDYAIAQVDFYADGNLLGSVSNEPFSYTWNGAPAGNYSLTAVATDSASQTTISVAVAVRVAVPPLVINLAPGGTAVRDGGEGIPWLNNLDNSDNDLVYWVGITWGTQQTFHTLYVQCGSEEGHYPVDVDLQVAKPGVTNPNIDIDDDWTTPAGWSLRGNANDFLAVSTDSPVATCGVRVKPVEGTWRPVELLALSGVTSNVMAGATVGGLDDWQTWGGGPFSRMWNGDFWYEDQIGIENPAPPPVTFDWDTPQTIAGVMVSGGAGSYPTAYDVEYKDAEDNWQLAVSVTDIDHQLSCHGFLPATSQHFRLKLKGTSDNQYQRISEIMLFKVAVPPPAPGTVITIR